MDRGKLFEDNQGLVFHVWKKIKEKTPKAIVRNNEDDIIQEGLVGLWLAAERFDETRGTQFATYATPYIGGYIKKYIADETGMRKRTEQPTIVSLDVPSGDTTWLECIPAPETEDVTWILESDQLNDFQKAVARMTYEGYSQREIEQALGKSRTTVGTTLKQIGKILSK